MISMAGFVTAVVRTRPSNWRRLEGFRVTRSAVAVGTTSHNSSVRPRLRVVIGLTVAV